MLRHRNSTVGLPNWAATCSQSPHRRVTMYNVLNYHAHAFYGRKPNISRVTPVGGPTWCQHMSNASYITSRVPLSPRGPCPIESDRQERFYHASIICPAPPLLSHTSMTSPLPRIGVVLCLTRLSKASVVTLSYAPSVELHVSCRSPPMYSCIIALLVRCRMYYTCLTSP